MLQVTEILVFCRYFWLFPEGPFPDRPGPSPSPSPYSTQLPRESEKSFQKAGEEKTRGENPTSQRSRDGGDPRHRAGEPTGRQGGAGGLRLGTVGGCRYCSISGWRCLSGCRAARRGCLQAGEACEVGGEPLETPSLPKQSFPLRSLASLCPLRPCPLLLFFFFFYTQQCFKLFL